MSEKQKELEEEEPAETEEEIITFEERFKIWVQKSGPYVRRLWNNRKRFIIFNAVVFIVVLIYLLFLTHPYFNSTISILPDYGTKETTFGQLSSLASLAGVNLSSGGAPTEIYQNLITSESVIGPVLFEKYKTEKYADSVNLFQYFKIKSKNKAPDTVEKRKMFMEGYKALTKNISTDLDRMTRILTISVTMPEAQLSADVVNNLANSLDNYIRTKRKSYSTEQRRYVEKRLGQVKDSLTNVENNLKNFRDQNRMVDQSPDLMLEQARLSRNVEILNAVYIELSKQLEIAKIDEIRDTPVVNIKEYAKEPVLKAGPARLSILIKLMIFSVLISMFYFLFKDNIKKYLTLAGIDTNKFKRTKKSGN